MRNVRRATALTLTRGLSIYSLLYGSLISRSPLLRVARCLSLSLSLSLSLYLSLFPRALASVSPICRKYKPVPLSVSLSLSLSLLVSRLRPLPSPAAPIHLSGGTTTLRARYSLFPLLAPCAGLLLWLLCVRIALRRAYSRSRSPALLDPLVYVRGSPSHGCAVSYALFRGARPGDASV